jgi:hypothetical protein
MNHPGFISYVVPFVPSESIVTVDKRPFIFSNHTPEETIDIFNTFVSKLVSDYGMEVLSSSKDKRTTKYDLKYHYVNLKLYTSKSEYPGVLRIHFDLKYDHLTQYGNTVDWLVFNELNEMYKTIETELLYH